MIPDKAGRQIRIHSIPQKNGNDFLVPLITRPKKRRPALSRPLFTGDAVPMTQDCRQCGKCCEKWGWDQKGIPEDLVPWITGNRQDILSHVLVRFSDRSSRTAAGLALNDLPRIERIYYWVEPDGKKRHSCPFYEQRNDGRVYCRIHDTKPAVCIGFAPWASVWHDYGLNCPACRDTTP